MAKPLFLFSLSNYGTGKCFLKTPQQNNDNIYWSERIKKTLHKEKLGKATSQKNVFYQSSAKRETTCFKNLPKFLPIIGASEEPYP